MTAWFDNLKIRAKLLVVFGLLVFIMVAFAFFTITQITVIGRQNNELISSYQARQLNIAEASVDLYKMRFANLSRVYLLDEDNFEHIISIILAGYDRNAESFMRNLNQYREVTLDDSIYTASEKSIRLNIIDGIFDSFAKYEDKVEQLKVALGNSDRPGVVRVLEECVAIGNDLSDKLDDLRDLVFYSIRKKVQDAANSTANTINAIILATAAFMALSLLALLFTVNNLNKPILRLEKAAAEISAGNLDYPIRSGRKDELGVLSDRIGDMVTKITEHNKTITIMDNLDAITCVTDTEYNLLFINRHVINLFGVDKNGRIGQKCYKALRGLDKPCDFCHLQKLLPEKETLPVIKFDYLWDEHLGIWIGGFDSFIRWMDGSYAYLRYARDVTDRKRQDEIIKDALRSAEMASVAKSNFLANMSHEMRTPMNAVIGFAELMMSEKADEAGCGACAGELQKIRNAGLTLLGIINEILDISNLDSGNFNIEPVEYDLASLINDTIVLNNSRIGEKPIRLALEIDEGLPSKLCGDEMRVKQICNNLLSNAIKNTDRGTVTLRFECARGAESGSDESVQMTITVVDTGIGIREQDLPKLFYNFDQTDAGSNRATDGAGLGLALTRKLSELMGGGISVESVYGKGSTFSVRILQKHVTDVPIGRFTVENLRSFKYAESKRSKGFGLRRARYPNASVLLVDDLLVNLEIAKGLMKPYGMRVDCVTSGAEAADAIRREEVKYSAIFMDHMMPGMDGVETVKVIREDIGTDYAKNIPIIVLTANAIAGNEEMFLSKGFQAFLSKPIDIVRLDAVIRQWIGSGGADEDAGSGAETQYGLSDAGSGTETQYGLSDSNPGAAAQYGLYDSNSGAAAQLTVSEIGAATGIADSNAQAGEPDGWAVDDIDTAGLLRRFGDFKTAENVLRIFAEETPSLLERIKDVEPGGLADYVITVHGLKGSCFGIMAEALGERARRLEDAARASDYDYVAGNNLEFVDGVRTLISNIKEYLNSKTDKKVKKEPDAGLLSNLLEYCRLYDIDGLDSVMSELTSYEYESGQELVDWLNGTAKMLGFKQIVQKLTQLLQS